MSLESALQRFCVGKDAEDVYFILAENLDLILTAGEILHNGGEQADRLRDTVRQLKIDMVLAMEEA